MGNGNLKIRCRHPVHDRQQHGQVWDPEAMWTTVTDATRSALTALSQGVSLEDRVRDSEIVGVAVASVGESGVPLDCQGQALYPIIPWFDTRTFQQAQWWAREIGRSELHKSQGFPLSPSTPHKNSLAVARGEWPQ